MLFDNKRNAGTQRIIAGRAKKIDKKRISEEKRSILLKTTSPVKINMLLIKRSEAEKIIRIVKGEIPNISDKSIIAAMPSTIPSILTNILSFL